MIKTLVPITLLVILIQISFSLYYSTKIIDLNTQFQTLQKKTHKITLENQNLQVTLSQILSIDNLKQFSQNNSYQKINQSLDLSQP